MKVGNARVVTGETGLVPDTAMLNDVGRLPALDPVMHSHGRLNVMLALLGRVDPILFPQLQELLEMTSGNLSTHLRRLEEAGYVEIRKGHVDRKPVTWVSATSSGARASAAYVDAMRTYLDAMSESLLDRGRPQAGRSGRRNDRGKDD